METEHQKVQTIQVSMEENKSVYSKQSSRKISIQEFDTESKYSQSQQIFQRVQDNSQNDSFPSDFIHSPANLKLSLVPHNVPGISPQKVQKEENEGTYVHLKREQGVSQILDKGSTLKVRFNVSLPESQMCPSHKDQKLNLYCRDCEKKVCLECINKKNHQGHQVESVDSLIESRRELWRSYLEQQRLKVASLIKSVDQSSFNDIDQELRQVIVNPFEKSEQILTKYDQVDKKVNRLIHAHNIKKLIYQYSSTDHLDVLYTEFEIEMRNLKAMLYLSKRIEQQNKIESDLKDLIWKEITEVKNNSKKELEYATSKISQIENDIVPQLDEFLPKHKTLDDIQNLKKNQSEIVQAIEDLISIKNQSLQDQQQIDILSKQLKDFTVEFELLKSHVNSFQDDSHNHRQEHEQKLSKVDEKQSWEIANLTKKINDIEKGLNQSQTKQLSFLQVDVDSLKDHQKSLATKVDLVGLQVQKVNQDFANYVQEELDRRQCSWQVESGEEAHIETQAHINTILKLSNRMLVVSSYSNSKNLLEIFDSVNDYEQLRTIQTFHKQTISCMIEHNKVLLTGSYDQTIGFWDIYNNFQLLQQYTQSNDECLTDLLSIDQRYFISSCTQGTLKIWDSVNNVLACNKNNAHKAKINRIGLLSKFRLVTCSNDKQASIWQLQGPNMTKVRDLAHNSFVVGAIEIGQIDKKDTSERIATVTMQGVVFIWDLNAKADNAIVAQYKIDNENVVTQCNLMIDYDYKLFPFILVKSLNSVHIMQLSTGKSQKLKIRLLNSEFQQTSDGTVVKDGVGDLRRLIQIDSQHLLIADGTNLRVILIEFENIKDTIL